MSDTNVNLPLQGELLRETQDLAQELNVSWPLLIVLALQSFLHRRRGQKNLLERLNAAYADGQGSDDLEVVQRMRPTHRKMVEDEW